MSDNMEIHQLKQQVASLEEKIEQFISHNNRYGFSRFATDLLTGFLVVSAAIFWITFIFVLVTRNG